MDSTPWSSYVVKNQVTMFYFGYDTGGGLVVLLENRDAEKAWACQAAPGRPTSRIAALHSQVWQDFPPYTFDLTPPARRTHKEAVCVYAHPFALAYLYAAELMAPEEVIRIGQTTARDTFQIQHPITTPCPLTNTLGTTDVTLVLSARYDLEVR